MTPLILASTSKYRKALLEKLGIPFIAVSPNFVETMVENEQPQDRAQRLAEGKARALAQQFPSHIIIGSDQVAHLAPDQILSKPGGFENARAQLKSCAGHTVEFYTGLCALNTVTSRALLGVETFRVHFRQLSDLQIERYLQKEQPYECAGSFKAEGLGISLFKSLEGRDPNTLIGLPLILLVDFLAKEGIEIP